MPASLTALFLGTFALGTTEFIVAGLLPSVARDLSVSIPVAGFVVTAYALGVAVGGPLLSLALSRVPPKISLLLLIGVFSLGQAACALAPDFTLLVADRGVVAACHGAFFGIAAVLATQVLPAERAGRAVAVLLAGITSANVLGVPAGTAIGGLLGWRASFWCVLALGTIATTAIAIWVPHVAHKQSAGDSLSRQVEQVAKPTVWLTFAVVIFSMMAQLALFTYISSYLTDVTGVAPGVIPWYLLLFGLGSTLGVIAGGRLADWKLMPALLGVLAAQALAYLVFVAQGSNQPFVTVFIVVWGLVAFAFTAPAQARVLREASAAPGLTSSLIPTAFNIGIALGALAGSFVLQMSGQVAILPWIGVSASVVAIGLALLSWRVETTKAAASVSNGERTTA